MTASMFLTIWVAGIMATLTCAAVFDAIRVWRETRAPRDVRRRLDRQALDISEALSRGNRRKHRG